MKKESGFLGGSVVKNLPANARDVVRSLGWEDPLEKEMATHLPRKPHEQRDPGGLQSMGSQRVRHNLAIKQQQQEDYNGSYSPYPSKYEDPICPAHAFGAALALQTFA